MRHVWLGLLALLISAPAAAQLSGSFRALTLDMPPFSVAVDPAKQEMQGYFGEIFVAAMRQAGLMENIAVDMIPWKRAQQNALTQPNVVIFPLIRNAVREEQYRWLALILEEPCYAWTTLPELPIDTLEQVRQAGKIGGLAGGPQTTEVRRILGPEYAAQVEDSPTEELALRKMLAGRIHMWSAHGITADHVARQYARINQLPAIKLRRGYKFFEANIWMAVSKQTSEDDARQIQLALEAFFLTPEYQAINRKYHIENRKQADVQ
jgi:polar amino acid transport system substrate-binding protein